MNKNDDKNLVPMYIGDGITRFVGKHGYGISGCINHPDELTEMEQSVLKELIINQAITLLADPKTVGSASFTRWDDILLIINSDAVTRRKLLIETFDRVGWSHQDTQNPDNNYAASSHRISLTTDEAQLIYNIIIGLILKCMANDEWQKRVLNGTDPKTITPNTSTGKVDIVDPDAVDSVVFEGDEIIDSILKNNGCRRSNDALKWLGHNNPKSLSVVKHFCAIINGVFVEHKFHADTKYFGCSENDDQTKSESESCE